MSGRGDSNNCKAGHSRQKRQRSYPESDSDDEEDDDDCCCRCCGWPPLGLFVVLILFVLFLYCCWCWKNYDYRLDANLALCSMGAKISIGKTNLCGPKDRINDPLSIISGKPVMPGDALCYGPKGVGEFSIRLAAPAIITAFSYEHITSESHPEGHIKSAPSTFLIFGLKTDSNSGRHSEIFLGKFEYLDNGCPLQSFHLKNHEEEMEFSEIKIHIVSNHGNPDFTCVYRIKIHGQEKRLKWGSKASWKEYYDNQCTTA